MHSFICFTLRDPLPIIWLLSGETLLSSSCDLHLGTFIPEIMSNVDILAIFKAVIHLPRKVTVLKRHIHLNNFTNYNIPYVDKQRHCT